MQVESQNCEHQELVTKNTIMAWLLIFLNRSQEAYQIANKTLQSDVINEKLVLAELEIILAHSSFDLTQFPVAAKHANNAITLLANQVESRLHVVASMWLGASKTQQSQYLEASDLLNSVHQRALRLKEPYLSAVSHNYLAIIQEELGNMTEAFDTYDNGIKYARLANDPNILGRILANVGEAYVNMNITDKALLYLAEAVVHLKVTRDKDLVSWCKMSMARAYELEGKHELAEPLFRKAIQMSRYSKGDRTYAENLVAYGKFMLARGRHIIAKRSLIQALELVEKIPIEREIFKTHLALAELYEKTNKYPLALTHFKAFYNVRSKLWDDAARVKIERLQKAFELDHAKQQREIEKLRNVELATANKKLAQQAVLLKDIAIRDALTKLYNRRHMWEVMEKEEKKSNKSGQPLCIAFLDIDHFKAINDNFSHAIGDDTLIALAQVLTYAVGHTNFVARWGGEEFVLLLPACDIIEAEKTCEFIRRKIEVFNWSKINKKLKVTASFGVAQLTFGQSIEAALNIADERLYHAKQTGRNKVVAHYLHGS